MDHLSL